MNETSCLFFRIAAGTVPAHIVWTDTEHVAFPDRRPVASGHVLLIPRIHASTVYDLALAAFARLFERARILAGPVAHAPGAPRAGIAVEGFGVDHAHIHLVPVWRVGDLDPRRQRQASAWNQPADG